MSAARGAAGAPPPRHGARGSLAQQQARDRVSRREVLRWLVGQRIGEERRRLRECAERLKELPCEAALQDAFKQGDQEACRVHIESAFTSNEARRSLSARDGVQKRTLAHFAARYGHAEVLRLLVDSAFAAVHRRDALGCTPLWWAAANGHLECVRLLADAPRERAAEDAIDMPCNVHVDQSPIHVACAAGHLAVVQFLTSPPVAHRVDIGRQCGGRGRTPLMEAASAARVDVCRWLLADERIGRVGLGATDSSGNTALRLACLTQDTELVRVFADAYGANAAGSLGHADALALHDTIAHPKANVGVLHVLLQLAVAGRLDVAVRGHADSSILEDAVGVGMGEAVVRALLDPAAPWFTLLPWDTWLAKWQSDGRSALQAAYAAGHKGVVRFLLSPAGRWRTECEATLRRGDIDGGANAARADLAADVTALLHSSCVDGHVDLVETLCAPPFRELVDVLYADTRGRTGFFHACEKGFPDVVVTLICAVTKEAAMHRGDDIVLRKLDSSGRTPFLAACDSGRAAVIEVLLRSGRIRRLCNVNRTCVYLQCAYQPRWRSKRAEFRTAVNTGRSQSAWWAIASGGHADAARVILADDELVELFRVAEPHTCDGLAALHVAAMGGHLEMVQLLTSDELLRRGVDVNVATMETTATVALSGRTALFCAADFGHTDIVKHLLSLRCDPPLDVNRSTDDEGMTPLLAACAAGHVECVRALLLDERIDVLQICNRGRSALHWAACEGHGVVVEILQRDPRAKTIDVWEPEGDIPLHVAMSRRHLDVILALPGFSEHHEASEVARALLEELLLGDEGGDGALPVAAALHAAGTKRRQRLARMGLTHPSRSEWPLFSIMAMAMQFNEPFGLSPSLSCGDDWSDARYEELRHLDKAVGGRAAVVLTIRKAMSERTVPPRDESIMFRFADMLDTIVVPRVLIATWSHWRTKRRRARVAHDVEAEAKSSSIGGTKAPTHVKPVPQTERKLLCLFEAVPRAAIAEVLSQVGQVGKPHER